MKLFAMIMGALGIVANVLIYQQKTGKKLLVYKLISDVLWALHYALLGAWAGMAVAAIGIGRETVFFHQDKKWAKGGWWLLFFLVCAWLSSALTWQSAFSILPATASTLSVISFWRNQPSLSRALAFPISACMLTYDITCLSYMGMANEIFTLTSALIGVIAACRRKVSTEKSHS